MDMNTQIITETEKRVLISLKIRPSALGRIELDRHKKGQNRSEWIERACLAALTSEKDPEG